MPTPDAFPLLIARRDAIAAAALAALSGCTLAASLTTTMSTYQLRIYEIFEHNKAAFHARFRDHAARIMRRHGFDIRAMWEARTPQRTEFVYLLRWPDEPTLKRAWSQFMADAEWSRIKQETAQVDGVMVGAIEDRVLRTLDYSPDPAAR